jgi:triacylglycerol esterase/lipase EstA (alpha/beta hydrolase family)
MAGTHTIATVAMALLATSAMAGAAAAVQVSGTTDPVTSIPDGTLVPVAADADGGTLDGTPVADRWAATSRSVADEAPGDEPVLLVHGFLDTGYAPWWAVTEAHLADHGYDEGDVYKLTLGAIPGSTVDSPADYGHAVCDVVQQLSARYDSEVDVVDQYVHRFD